MRISVVFVAVMVLGAPVRASANCMNLGEARHHFGSVHLYWHGSNHCWDASPGHRRDSSATQRHARRHERPEARGPKWREARSELVADTEPARARQDKADQPVAAPDAPPIRITPVKLVSFLSDWSERWVDVEQKTVPDRLTKAQPAPFAAPAPEQQSDLVAVVHGLALFTFGFGLVLTFVTLLKGSNASPTGPPLIDSGSSAINDVVAAHAEKGSDSLQTERDDIEAKLQSPTAPPAHKSFGRRSLGTVPQFLVVLVSRQASSMCWRALRWGRHIGAFISDGAYPMEVKWPSHSAGAMISRDEDVSLPYTLPSRLLEETRQAASRAVSPRTLPRARTGTG
jgi:hypothetical protein